MNATCIEPKLQTPTQGQCAGPQLRLIIPAAFNPDNPRRSADWRAQSIDYLSKYDPEGLYPWPDPWRKLVGQVRQIDYGLPLKNEVYCELPFSILIAESMAFNGTNSSSSGATNSQVSRGGNLRNIIESYTLAGVPEKVIIEELNIFPPAVISSYLALYFDVGDRLGDRDFILHHVLQCDPTQGLDHHEPYQFWREVGYLGGEECLRRVTSICRIVDNLSYTRTDEYFDDKKPVSAIVREIIWLRRLPDYERTFEDLEKLYRRLLEAPDA